MSTNARPSRREFIEKAATLGAIGLSGPRLAQAQPAKQPGPNDRMHLGIIGCGGMGRGNLRNCVMHPDVVLTGACDIWRDRLDPVVAEFKESCKPYHDFREMLQQPDIDAVIIGTPPHWHCLQAIAAAEAKKDLYVQKPMTLYVGESLALRNAVQKHEVICQVGTQIHASENYRRVVEFLQAGLLGEIGVVRTFHVLNQWPDGVGHDPNTTPPEGLDWDLWCGPAEKCAYNRFLALSAYHHGSWMRYSGGWTPGMAPHIIDLPIWALDLKYPVETFSSGGRYFLKDDGDAYDNHEILWKYPNLTLHWFTSLTNSYGFDFQGDPGTRRRLGTYFHGSKGTLYADYGTYKIISEGDRMNGVLPPPASIPRSPGHEREWLDCVKSRLQPSCNPNYHVRVDVPVCLSLLSYQLGRSIHFAPTAEKILGDPEAARLSVPEYRDPWKFPAEYLPA
ncbi:MAG: hypothetical protein COZ06_06385 [Armatimonadetes bacterium CG_4_10_14_3_um_filter_66_18]|nr:MAG: hypothetical protein COZ06_06385 [Armatimonadetes bacterium CG_4_10_14_3_um_filter_66_18]